MLKIIYEKTIGRLLKLLYERLIKPVFKAEGSPHSVALGVAIGVFVGFTPTVGLQMVLCVIVCSIVKANVLVAVAISWISNPVTFIPMYWAYYKVGLVAMNKDGISGAEFKQRIENNYVIVTIAEKNDNYRPFKIKEIAVAKARENNTQLAIAEKKIYYYEAKNENAQVILKNLTDNTLAKYQEVKGYPDIFAKLREKKSYGLMDMWSFLKFQQRERSLTIVAEIEREYDLWGSFGRVVALSFEQFAVPMWIGSLLIALLLAGTAYPITKSAIVRFREPIERLKEKGKVPLEKIKEKGGQIREKSKVPIEKLKEKGGQIREKSRVPIEKLKEKTHKFRNRKSKNSDEDLET